MGSSVTVMGHAGVFVQSAGHNILVDPILRTTPLASGSVEHTYTRALDLGAMPRPTQLVLTHAHLDHYDPESLRSLDRALPVLVPQDTTLQSELRALGFEQITAIAPWQTHRLGALGLTATPSHAGVVEWGLVFGLRDGTYAHAADSEPALADARRVVADHGPIDLASIKFQPAAPGSAAMRGLGAYFNKDEVAEWLQCALELRPRFAFPYASGIRYCGRHAWLNRYAFPFHSTEIADLLRPALSEGHQIAPVLPGDVLELGPSGVTHHVQASPFVRHIDDDAAEPHWEPFDAHTMLGLSNDAERDELTTRVEKLLARELAPFIARSRDDADSPIQHYVQFGVVYQLVIHLGEDRSLEYAIDFRQRLRLTAGRHPLANYFAHLSGRGLLDVLRGELGPELFYMSGDVRQYEKVLCVRDGQVHTPSLQGWNLFEQLAEPLTHYLRHHHAAGSLQAL